MSCFALAWMVSLLIVCIMLPAPSVSEEASDMRPLLLGARVWILLHAAARLRAGFVGEGGRRLSYARTELGSTLRPPLTHPTSAREMQVPKDYEALEAEADHGGTPGARAAGDYGWLEETP